MEHLTQNVKYKTTMLKSSPYHYIDAYIALKGTYLVLI